MKKVTMRYLAQEAGVSLSTVSRVINDNGYVTEDKRKLVLDTMRRLGYQESGSNSTDSSNLPIKLIAVAYLVKNYPVSLNPFLLVNNCITDAAKDSGYNIIFFPIAKIDNQSLITVLKKVQSLPNFCGLIINGSFEDDTSEVLQELLNEVHFPVVYLGAACNTPNFNEVLVNNTYGVYQATLHLIRNGHKELLFINSHAFGDMVAKERLAGFRQAISEFEGVKAYEYDAIEHDDNHHNTNCGYFPLEKMIAEHPEITGVVNWSDIFLPGELRFISENRNRIASNFEVIGFGDILAPVLNPPVSAVQMPYTDMAQNAITIIKEAEERTTPPVSKVVTLFPRLIIR